MGRAFGTIGCRKGDWQVEITTYRSESYDPASRKPDVDFGDSLAGDLGRRDFTVNAMAVLVPDRTFEDPYGGVVDLAHRVLRTPGRPEDSFSDDPLRMMRAARFAAQLGFTVDPAVVAAMTAMADRIEIISAERVRDELVKLVCGPYPRLGLTLLVETGLAEHVLPELPALALERDEHHRHKDVYEHTLTVLEQAMELEHRLPVAGRTSSSRFAALMHDVGKPRTRRFLDDGTVTFHHHDVVGAKMTRKRMKALRFSNDAHRRGVQAGRAAPALPRVRRRRVDRLRRTPLRARRRRPARAAAHPDPRRLHHPQPAQGGAAAADLRRPRGADRPAVGAGGAGRHPARPRRQPDHGDPRASAPGREVGAAYRFLLDLRLEHGPLDEETAKAALLEWWASRSDG